MPSTRPLPRLGLPSWLWMVLGVGVLSGCGGGLATPEIRPATRPTPAAIVELPLDLHILVDQFGYRPADPKVAVIRTPVEGFDAAESYAPGALYEVRPTDGSKPVHVGGLQPWNDGAAQRSSGDRGWWFDFSAVQTPGEYVVVDVERKRRSAVFTIAPTVYAPVLKAATRMFFYQRSGVAKDARHAGACWADDAAYAGPFQDLEARDVADPDNASRGRNLSGGWFDAGDTNRYTSFASIAVHQLLGAYRDHPAAFGDDNGIPESGNGVPDLLDEVAFELDWLLRMQNADGSAALKVGGLKSDGASPPSTDDARRYYIASCSSATLSVASMFAHAAVVFRTIPALETQATRLELRALKAWEHFEARPGFETDCDTLAIRAGDADRTAQEQQGLASVAAVYLHALTGEARFGNYVKAHLDTMQPFRDSGFIRYNAHEGEALRYYARLPIADPEVRRRIDDAEAADLANGGGVYGLIEAEDLYRNPLHDDQYHWGSNQIRSNYGATNVAALHAVADPVQRASLTARALATLNYLHGVNPLGLVYLSNMAEYGATRSVNAIFHSWFRKESPRWGRAGVSTCGPAPGYLVGGPNRHAQADGVPPDRRPPVGQPPQKSYLDDNDTANAAWVYSEPAIYYQAAYIRLLAAFAGPEPLPAPPRAASEREAETDADAPAPSADAPL